MMRMSAVLLSFLLKSGRATSLDNGSTLNACSAAKQWVGAGRSQQHCGALTPSPLPPRTIASVAGCP